MQMLVFGETFVPENVFFNPLRKTLALPSIIFFIKSKCAHDCESPGQIRSVAPSHFYVKHHKAEAYSS